ncbi:AAA family ATPase [Marinomonas foliarum]|uniref:AAA family ATPase n=1 Tax=Marinomonas foliarum TaxID=491950 RepID=A0ABX7IM11_9GAMM|nr:AAA family ATPase [Marinomonas foliarum]QRV23371.1 AAA family ATPase [Marinomonas foliarum]
MKITFKNLGAIKQANLILGDLTIVCGKNNTGKTYVTYATYGFLDYWHKQLSIEIPSDVVTQVMDKGSISVPIELFAKDAKKILKEASIQFSKHIDKVFAGKESLFEGASLSVEVDKSNDYNANDVSFEAGSSSRTFLKVTSEKDDENLTISLLVDKSSEDLPPRSFIENMICAAVRELVFKNKVPRPFIASAERTGAAIFQKELDFTRSRLLDMLGDKDSHLSFSKLLGGFKAEYPIPVKKNIDFIRGLSSITNKESMFSKQHPEVLEHFKDIIGGEYKVNKEGEIQYIPNKNQRVKLSLVESSSAVRSLLDIGFYLRHEAQIGDVIMVDEPELNLHPENQRKVARLFAMLVNHGIKVFITTHSDFIIKELNTLILLNQKSDHLLELAKREGYSEGEFLSHERLKVYMAKEDSILLEGRKKKSTCNTLVPAEITAETGISLQSFDSTIEEMNRIQDEIVWGE